MAGLLVTVPSTTFRPAERLQRRGGVLRLVVDVMMGAQLLGQGLLVGAAGNSDGHEAELGGELHPKVPEPADAEDGNQVPPGGRRSGAAR